MYLHNNIFIFTLPYVFLFIRLLTNNTIDFLYANNKNGFYFQSNIIVIIRRYTYVVLSLTLIGQLSIIFPGKNIFYGQCRRYLYFMDYYSFIYRYFRYGKCLREYCIQYNFIQQQNDIIIIYAIQIDYLSIDFVGFLETVQSILA